MEIPEIAEQVMSKEDFIYFLHKLQSDFRQNQGEWENVDLESYLEAMEAFLSGSTENSLVRVDFTPSWKLFAKIMVTASVYE